MEGVLLEEADCEKDLGVTFTTDLKTRQHPTIKTYTLKPTVCWAYLAGQSSSIGPTLYKSLVRLHLEYCSTIWNSLYNKDKFLLERIQHRFTQIFSSPQTITTGRTSVGTVVPGRKKEQSWLDKRIVIHSLVTFFSKRLKTLQPTGTLGNWRRSIVAVIYVCTSLDNRLSVH